MNDEFLFWLLRRFRKVMSRLFFNPDFSPKRCINCWSSKFEETEKDSIANTVCEIEICCSRCGQYVGYWSYGIYDSALIRHYVFKDL